MDKLTDEARRVLLPLYRRAMADVVHHWDDQARQDARDEFDREARAFGDPAAMRTLCAQEAEQGLSPGDYL